ncbi:YceI family protein [Ascidiimonas aurantiaca]|uniref:YceI family protein n=1 Tax=Ascidiimonas aurantiaca TaxID=1685432 RepID=UPI0030EC1DDF
MVRITLILFFFIISCVASVQAQELYLNRDVSVLKVSGTSTLHDWTVNATHYTVVTTFKDLSDVTTLKDLQVTVVSNGLKSGKKGMEKSMYRALQSSLFPTINFQLQEVTSVSKNGDNHYTLECNGYLTTAGVKKPVSLSLQIETDTNGIWLSGEKPLKMTDYGIKPPKALLGVVKAGNEVEVSFKVRMEKQR